MKFSIEIEIFEPGLKISSVWIENFTRSIEIEFFQSQGPLGSVLRSDSQGKSLCRKNSGKKKLAEAELSHFNSVRKRPSTVRGHYGVVAKHHGGSKNYGGVSETPCFPGGEIHREISTKIADCYGDSTNYY